MGNCFKSEVLEQRIEDFEDKDQNWILYEFDYTDNNPDLKVGVDLKVREKYSSGRNQPQAKKMIKEAEASKRFAEK